MFNGDRFLVYFEISYDACLGRLASPDRAETVTTHMILLEVLVIFSH